MIPPRKQPDELESCPDSQEEEQINVPEGDDSADFLAEERALDRELNTLFNLEGEDLPPLFVQTLMSEQGDWMIPPGLEQRLLYRVFHRLQLPYLPPTKRPQSEQPPRSYQRLWHLSRTAGLGATLTVLLLTMVVLLPSLGERLHVPSIPAQLPSYPGATLSTLALTHYLSLRQTQAVVSFPAYWLNWDPTNYTYESFVLHMGQSWANGPVVEMRYGHSNPRIGYGQLILREFRPAGGSTSLEVVDQHAAQVIQMGNHQAIYINGGWVQENGEVFWQTGFQAQLLYQDHGLIFWFIADARDEATLQSFEALAQLLEPLYLGPPNHHLPELTNLPEAQAAGRLTLATPGSVVGQLPVGTPAAGGATVYIALGYPSVGK